MNNAISDEMIKELETAFGGKTRRLRILIDNKEFLSASIRMDELPKNSEELLLILKDLVNIKELPDIPDPEVLGKYSPPI